MRSHGLTVHALISNSGSLAIIRRDPPRLATLVLIRVSILRPEEPNRTTGWPSTYPRTDFQKYSDPNERTPKITPT
jgi:hypothetical protein